MRHITRSVLLALVPVLGLPLAARAALVLQAEVPNYVLASDGVTPTQVKVYLAQTDGTTTLTTGRGINQFEISLGITGPAEGTRPVLQQVQTNPEFTGNKIQSVDTSTMGGSFLDQTVGVAAVDGRVFLGTFAFTGSPTVPSTTYRIMAPAVEGYTFTASGSDLGGLIGPGTFTLAVVPEPSTAGVAAMAMLLLARRLR